jgi:hypothetical protein
MRMNVNERIAGLLVARAARLADESHVDRHQVGMLADVAAREVVERPAQPTSAWEAVREQICSSGVVAVRRADPAMLDALLADTAVTPGEIRTLYEQVRGDDALVARVVSHRNAPGDLVVAYVMDSRRDSLPFTRDELRAQRTMMQRMVDVTGAQRLEAWATLVVRAARSPETADDISALLIASPDASVVLHAAVQAALTHTSRLPDALGRQLLSHLSLPATIASLSLRELLRLIDHGERVGHRVDRIIDLMCDMLATACGRNTDRWEALFGAAPTWSRSLGELLDTIEHDETPAAGRSRHDVPGYRRDPRSRLLKPIDYSVLRVPQARRSAAG